METERNGYEGSVGGVRDTFTEATLKEKIQKVGETAVEVGRIAVPQIRRSVEHLVKTGWGNRIKP